MQNLQKYMRIKEAANFLGVSAPTLRNWEKRQKIRTYRNPVNGYRLYKQDDLRVFLKRVEQPSQSIVSDAKWGRK